MSASNPYVVPPPISPSNPAPPNGLGANPYANRNTGNDVDPTKQGKIPPIVIVGFIFSLLGGILGAILCIIGLSEAKKRGAGENLAIAGIVISILTTLYWLSMF